jgi:uncharacterized repeat protein (TIGR01451 family)
MKRYISSIAFYTCFLCLLITSTIKGQSSPNTVKYKITYDAITQVYTTWVTPDYSVPNSNNVMLVEQGGTAQFTVVVPKDFVITSITDINGTWTKTTETAFRKLGPGQPGQSWTGLDPALNYYVIGKSPSETNYGTFTQGVPVKLFSFTGNGCYGVVKPLPPNDPFIQQSNDTYSLNVGNSFYSRSAQPSGGNQVPLEQFINITGESANCLPLVANPDNVTIGSGTTLPAINVLQNDSKGGNIPTTSDVTVSISENPANGTATVNSDGTIKYIPNPNFVGKDCFVYKICDNVNTALCDTAKVCVSVTNGKSDIRITKTLNGNSKVTALNSNVTYTILVENLGIDNATNIVVKDSLGAGLQYVSNTVTTGTFINPIWSIPSLSNGTSATLTVTAKVIAQGVSFNYAKVQSLDQVDLSLNNNESKACVSVPIKLCSGEKLEVTVPIQYTNVVWYNAGVSVGTGNTLLISGPGSYTTTANNIQCPATGCCPIVVEDGNCCPANICVPFSVTKVKK